MVLKVSTEQIITSTINSKKHFMDNDTIFRFYGPRYYVFVADLKEQDTILFYFWQILWTKILFAADKNEHDNICSNFLCPKV